MTGKVAQTAGGAAKTVGSAVGSKLTSLRPLLILRSANLLAHTDTTATAGRTVGNVSSTGAGVVGNLANTGYQTAAAARRGDVKGTATGLAKGTGQTVAGAGKGVDDTVTGVGKGLNNTVRIHDSLVDYASVFGHSALTAYRFPASAAILAILLGDRRGLCLRIRRVCSAVCLSLWWNTWSLKCGRCVDYAKPTGNVGNTASAATSGLGKTVGDTTGALGKGDISGVAAGATGGVSLTSYPTDTALVSIC